MTNGLFVMAPVLEKDEVHVLVGIFNYSAPLASGVINLLSEK